MVEPRLRFVVILSMVCLVGLALLSCRGPSPGSASDAAAVPISTDSEEARASYLQGRDLVEKLRITDAREHYARAAELDPEFPLAHLGLANTAATANEFWQSLETAMTTSDRASEGERLLILAADAGARGAVAEQEQYLSRLADEYPEDPRVLNLLGQYYFGRQEWTRAVESYERATSLAPDFSQPYNQLGYAQRFLGNYDRAEEAFKKYVELIPGEPNPYDSYAELLMKLGRFEESIDNYHKALEQDPYFIASYIGIGNDLMFMGQGEAARENFGKLREIARNDAERRQALFWTAASFVHEGRIDDALEALQARYAVAEESDDRPAMAFDLVQIGNVLLESGGPDEAMERYVEGLAMMETAEVPEDNKDNFRRNHLFREARVALAAGDLRKAKDLASAYSEQVAAHGIPFEIRQDHWLLGLIAMQDDDPATALEHFEQANLQDPRVLYDMALAQRDLGDAEAARSLLEQVARFNGLNFNYAFVREPVRRMLAGG